MTPRVFGAIEVGIKIAREFGFPITMLVFVMLGLSRVAATLHGDVVLPIVKAHSAFLQSTQETIKTLGVTQSVQTEALRKVVITQQEIAATQRDIQRVICERLSEGEKPSRD